MRGQAALEYLLMIAGGVLVAAVLMVVVNNNLNLAASSVESSDYSTRLQNYLSTATPGSDDGDWVIVGDNQFSNVPGYVGIGTTNPQAKLEVNGKILMDDATVASDSVNTVATKGYVDGLQSVLVGASGVNASQIQLRVIGSCATGSSIRVIGSDGSVTCQTGISPGQGSIGVADINSSQVQRRVNGTCSVGSYISAVAADGSVTCGQASSTSWNISGNNQYSSLNGSVGIGTSSPAQKLEVNGSILASGTGDVCNGAGKCLNSIYQTNVMVGTNPTCPSGQTPIMKASGGIWYTYDSTVVASAWNKVSCGVLMSSDGTPFLYYNTHTSQNCVDMHGTVVSDGTYLFCRFDGATCPTAEWTRYNGWSTTGPALVSCLITYSGCSASVSCTAPVHSWSNNSAVEGCDAGGVISCPDPAARGCYAVSARTHVGCY